MGNISGERIVEIDAPIERCFEIASDIDKAPEWQGSLKDVEVLERDADKRAALVETEADAKVKTVKSLLRFSYEEPTGIRWVQEKGDTKSLVGSWTLRGPRRGAHPRDLCARRGPGPDARPAAARPGRGQGARLPPRRRGGGPQEASGGRGLGAARQMADYTVVNLKRDVEDMAPKFELAPGLESRFARVPLGLANSGASYFKIAPGFRVPFGHRHGVQEEVYVVVSGGARLKLDVDVVELRQWDMVRIAPGVWRGIEGGPEGTELIAFGAPNTENKDAEMKPGWWSD